MAEIMVKKVEGCKVAVIEGQGPYDKVGPIFDEIFDWLSQRGIESPSPPFGIYYDNPSEVAPEKCRYEICVPIEGDVEGDERVKIKTVPETEVACITNKGPYSRIGPAWEDVFRWMEREGYQCVGAGREVYFNCPKDTPEEELLTEIQVPIRKKG